MSLQSGRNAAINGIKDAFKRATEMDGRSPEDITDELATNIIDAVITLVMSGDVNTSVNAPGSSVETGTGTGKVT